MRNRFADTLYGLAKENERICAVVADISPAGSMQKFRQEFPSRFINTGVAEQIMIGMAAGMAQRGLRPFAYTIATFALYRPFEFIRDDLCYQDLPVTVVGIGAGRLYSTLGATHHAQEDIAIATALPNLQVIAPCDPLEVEAATRWCAEESEHPTYLRLGKAGEPTFTAQASEPWQFGRWRYLQNAPTDRICIVSYGHTMKLAVEVAQRIDHGVSIVSAHTLKPMDVVGIVNILNRYKHVIVIEECTDAVLATQFERVSFWINGQKKGFADIHSYYLGSCFEHKYGSHDELLARSGLTVDDILAELNGVVNGG